MPASDRYHDTVVRCLTKAGWSIIKEQYAVVVADNNDNFRRLFIDIAARSQTDQIILIEVKSLGNSPVHQFMMLVGQYVVYRTALDYIGDRTPLYVAITEEDYQIMIEHPLAQRVIHDRLDEPIPFVTFNPIAEEIVKWIPSR
jgi:hypothetical protein